MNIGQRRMVIGFVYGIWITVTAFCSVSFILGYDLVAFGSLGAWLFISGYLVGIPNAQELKDLQRLQEMEE